MARSASSQPTDSELAILRILWNRGPSTVRDVQSELNRSRPTRYTTVLKFLQIMTAKGMVARDVDERSHVYIPRLSEQRTQRTLVKNLLDRAFNGSAHKLVMHALAAGKASPRELAEIRKILEKTTGG
jgi:predicted transcriptional regulator